MRINTTEPYRYGRSSIDEKQNKSPNTSRIMRTPYVASHPQRPRRPWWPHRIWIVQSPFLTRHGRVCRSACCWRILLHALILHSRTSLGALILRQQRKRPKAVLTAGSAYGHMGGDTWAPDLIAYSLCRACSSSGTGNAWLQQSINKIDDLSSRRMAGFDPQRDERIKSARPVQQTHATTTTSLIPDTTIGRALDLSFLGSWVQLHCERRLPRPWTNLTRHLPRRLAAQLRAERRQSSRRSNTTAVTLQLAGRPPMLNPYMFLLGCSSVDNNRAPPSVSTEMTKNSTIHPQRGFNAKLVILKEPALPEVHAVQFYRACGSPVHALIWKIKKISRLVSHRTLRRKPCA